MTAKEFDRLEKRDFDNGAVLNEIRMSLGMLEKTKQLLGAMADTAVVMGSFGAPLNRARCNYCHAKAEHPGVLRHHHMCLVARAQDLLNGR